MSEDIGDPKVAIKQTYQWDFPDVVVRSGWGAHRYVIRGVLVTIERGRMHYDDDYLHLSCYGVEARKDGKPDGRSLWGWHAYPEPAFTEPYMTRAKALWAAVHGAFREEPEE
jgi:hypothetical protein